VSDMDALPIFLRMIGAFLAAFPAIALWSRTREAPWVLVVLGILFLFVDAFVATLELIGLVSYDLPILPGFPLLESVLSLLPFLFFAAAFLVYLLRNRRY